MYSKDKACSSFQTITSNVHIHSITTSCIIFILLTIIPLLLAFTNNPNLCNNPNNPNLCNNQNINALFQAIIVQTLKPISRKVEENWFRTITKYILQNLQHGWRVIHVITLTLICVICVIYTRVVFYTMKQLHTKKVFFHFSKILCYVVLRDNIKFLQFSFSLLLFSLVDDFEQPYFDELGKVSLANYITFNRRLYVNVLSTLYMC